MPTFNQYFFESSIHLLVLNFITMQHIFIELYNYNYRQIKNSIINN